MLMGITRVLVANRGEIARRVFATCRRLGLGTVAVYTDPDAAAPHAAEADARVRLPQTTDYLNAEAIIAAAQAAGADAVHPGYGFLSENAEFAAAVQEAGLTWVGPPVDAVRAMGSKIESKKLMAAAGVPVLEELDPDAVTTAQLPVLVKASAGGGGRGMRVVHELSALPAEVEAARREAQSAFGDPTVFCERYLPTGHHVEVQVMADTHGTVWAVGERECSIQRRHQKIIEEAPSPLGILVKGGEVLEASKKMETVSSIATARTASTLNPVATDTVAARSGAFTTILRSASYAATPTAPVTTVGTAFARNPCYTIADAPFVCRCPEKHRSPALVTCCWHPASAPRWPTRRPRHRRAARVDRSAPA